MTAVITLANVFNKDSCAAEGRAEFGLPIRRCLFAVARPRANAGNANDCVNVSLCSDSLSEY